jgi:murein DD-endopeptidase MepM/ murein hydrolase activator NlpD
MESKKMKEGIKKSLAFIEKRSFYVIMVLCVGIVIFAGIFQTSRNIMSSIRFETEKIAQDVDWDFAGVEQNLAKDTLVDLRDDVLGKEESSSVSLDLEKQKPNPSISVSKENGEEIKKAKTPQEDRKEIPLGDKNIVMEPPVLGKIIFDYSMEKPIYSKTLNDWRTHPGMDLEAPLGTAVKAALDGKVKEVKNDNKYGITVVLEHLNGLVTVYSSLDKGMLPKEGQEVKKGDVIGSVGNSAPYESLIPPHLHFEVIKNGEHVDPKMYLSQWST